MQIYDVRSWTVYIADHLSGANLHKHRRRPTVGLTGWSSGSVIDISREGRSNYLV